MKVYASEYNRKRRLDTGLVIYDTKSLLFCEKMINLATAKLAVLTSAGPRAAHRADLSWTSARTVWKRCDRNIENQSGFASLSRWELNQLDFTILSSVILIENNHLNVTTLLS